MKPQLTPRALELIQRERKQLKPTRCAECNGSGRIRTKFRRQRVIEAKCEACKGRGCISTIPGYSVEDLLLLLEFPRHTLEQAREIKGAAGEPGFGFTSGFEKIIAQERGNFHLSGDHT